MVGTVNKVSRENRLIMEHIHTIKITSYRRLDVGELIAKVSSKTKEQNDFTSLKRAFGEDVFDLLGFKHKIHLWN